MLSVNFSGKQNTSGSVFIWGISVLFFVLVGSGVSLAIQDVGDTSKSVVEKQTMERLITQNGELLAEIRLLREEIARINLSLAKSEKERADLQQFIADHDAYGTAFEQYTYFREKTINEERLLKAAQAKAKRDAQKRRMQELREQRNNNRVIETDEKEKQREIENRNSMLKQAGFTQISDEVYVGQMGYAYKTTKHKDIRYSPALEMYYLDEDEEIDYNKMTLSGSIIHAGELDHDLSIAIAFYDAKNNQIGQTTIQIDGAKPGVPYPFTSEVLMADNRAFRSYAAWILYYEALVPRDMEVPVKADQPINNNEEQKTAEDKTADNSEVDNSEKEEDK